MGAYDNVPIFSALHLPTSAELAIISNLLAATGPNGGLLSEQAKYKVATTTYASASTTLQNDPDLVTPALVPTGVYDIACNLFYSTVAAALFKIAWAFPSGSAWTWQSLSLDASVTAANAGIINRGAQGSAALVLGCNAASTMACRIFGTLTMGATAGALQLQAAQSVSNATAPTVGLRSSLIAKRIA